MTELTMVMCGIHYVQLKESSALSKTEGEFDELEKQVSQLKVIKSVCANNIQTPHKIVVYEYPWPSLQCMIVCFMVELAE